MGIKEFHRFMKSHFEDIHIKKYAGKRVGIDAFSWLHKCGISCIKKLRECIENDKELPNLDNFMNRIRKLQYHAVIPLVVFDGRQLPCKDVTAYERHSKRQAYREEAKLKMQQGDFEAAIKLYKKGLIITPEMVHQTIQILRSNNIEFVVAPYEADAQLAYMSRLEAEKGGIAAVITEDSDLLAYDCPAVITKMKCGVNGKEFLLDKVFNDVQTKPSFVNFTKDMFVGMCVLAGCDYLQSIPGIGIAKAYTFVSSYENLNDVLSMLENKKGIKVPPYYSKSFRKAVAIFQHARIYDITCKQTRHLKPVSEELLQSLKGNLDFLGREIRHSSATAIALGELNPCTMEAYDHFSSAERNLYSKTESKARTQLPLQQANAVAQGKLNPSTKEAFDPFSSVERNRYPKTETKARTQLPLQKATCIGQSKLNPCTMEASDFSSAERSLYPKMATKPHSQLPLQKATAEGGIVPISSLKLRKEAHLPLQKETGEGGIVPIFSTKLRKEEPTFSVEQEQVSEMNQFSWVEDMKRFVEAFSPKNVLNHSSAGVVEEEKKDKVVLKIPNNNPFRKRCFIDIDPDEKESLTEQFLAVTKIESSEVLASRESKNPTSSKVLKKPEENIRDNIGKKAKNNFQSLMTKKKNILDYFPRV